MTIYATNILDAVLGEWTALGFRGVTTNMEEDADHVAIIYFKENLVAYVTQSTTVEDIRKICQRYFDSLNGG